MTTKPVGGRYRKKPVVIEAIQYTGRNAIEIMAWAKLPEISEGRICKCGERINPILGCYPSECAVCRLLKNFEEVKDGSSSQIGTRAQTGPLLSRSKTNRLSNDS